ncbi:MAG: hypothetical protein LW650_13590 [Planctomycetaceae bacterium]|nr:hypothetical protein [Phycisphaerales bacterium]MCE2654439.1 hypothetical protein [Planctomycetaceae bacterium]
MSRRNSVSVRLALWGVGGVMACAAAMAGCASDGAASADGAGTPAAVVDGGADVQTEIGVSAAGYAAAFEAVGEALRDEGFLLERVDAAAGVITTQRSTRATELGDVISRRQRQVRAEFVPEGQERADPAGDLRSGPQATRLRLTVRVEDIHRPGWRVPTSSVRLATRTSDPELTKRGLAPVYTVPAGEDEALAERLRAVVAARLGGG